MLLSIYVLPLASRTANEYAKRLAPLMQRVIPTLFDRYPGVRAIDLCQELANEASPEDSPPPVTRVMIMRKDAETIDWSTFDLATLRRHVHGRVPAIQLELTPEVRTSPAFIAAAPR